jgi:signal transduction histidine kinase/HAMP domain-containing protein
VLLLGVATSAILLYGFSRTQDDATERSRKALEEEGKLALEALVGGTSESGGLRFETVAEIGQRSARYIDTFNQDSPPSAYDASRLNRTAEGVYFDPDPGRTSDLVILNGGSPNADAVQHDLAFSLALDTIFPVLLEGFAGEVGGENLDPIAIVFISTNGVSRYYPPVGIHNTLPPVVDISDRMDRLGPGKNPARATIWTSPYTDAAGQGQILTARTPVYEGDIFRGSMEVDLSIDRIIEEINGIHPTPGGFAFYVDSAGNLWESDAFEQLNGERGDNADLAAILDAMKTSDGQSNVVVEESTLQGEEFFIAHAPMLSLGGSFAVAVPVSELTAEAAAINAGIEEEGNRTFLVVLTAMGTLFLAGLAAATYFNRRVLVAPIQQLAAATWAVAAGDLDTQVSLDRDDELGTLGDSFNSMVEQLRESERALEQRVEDRTRELAALLEVSRAVASSLDPKEVLGTILDQLGTIIEHTGSAILLVRDDAFEIVEARSITGYRAEVGARIPFEVGPILSDAMRHGETVIIEDIRADEPLAEGYRAAIGSIGLLNQPPFNVIRSWMAVPLALKGKTVGMVTMSWTEPSYFKPENARLARAFADQAAIAIENARLFDETQRRGRETDALLRADAELFQSLDPDAVFQALVDITVDVLGAHKSTVATWERGGHTALRAFRNIAPETRAMLEELYAAQPPRIGTPTVVVTEDPRDAHPMEVPIIAAEGIHSYIQVPIMSRDGLGLGFLAVAYTTEHKFSEEEQRLYGALADRAAVAIANARQLDETQNRARETEALFRADAELFQSLDLDRVLQALVDVMVDIVGADSSMVATWSATEPLRLRTAPNRPPEALAEVAAVLDSLRSERERVLGAGVIVMEGIDSAHPLLQPVWEREGIQAVIEVPIKSSRGNLLGAFTVTYLTPHSFSPEEQRLLKALAERAAVAIENAELYQRAQLAASLEERQRLARELHDSVSQALYGIALGARTARTLLDRDPAAAAEPVDYVLSLAEAGMAEMRALIFELRPESLETEGLVAAIGKQLDALQARHGIAVTRTLGEEPDLPLSSKEALYRIAQESLTNIAKHAKATVVSVTLAHGVTHVRLDVADNGVGFDPAGNYPGHLGLRSMQERAEKAGGTLTIDSAPGSRTTVWAKFPLG